MFREIWLKTVLAPFQALDRSARPGSTTRRYCARPADSGNAPSNPSRNQRASGARKCAMRPSLRESSTGATHTDPRISWSEVLAWKGEPSTKAQRRPGRRGHAVGEGGSEPGLRARTREGLGE